MTPQQLLDNEAIVAPNIDHLVLEDDTPVDNLQSAQQQRLLVEPLYSAKALPAPFFADANVGLFYKLKGDPIVPDVMLSLGVQRPDDFSQKQNRSTAEGQGDREERPVCPDPHTLLRCL